MASCSRFISVTLNPAIDRTVEVEELRLGEVVRGRVTYLEPAGKGVNVARTLAALGHEVTCTGFVGRGEASWFGRSLAAAGARAALVRVARTTRENLTYLETASGRETHIVETSFGVTRAEVRRLRARLATLVPAGDWVLLSGHPPSGLGVEDFRALLAELRKRGARLAVDSSGEYLQAAVEQAPEVIKPNREELSQLVGKELRRRSEVVRAARGLAEAIPYVVVSLGAEGAVCVTARGAWHGRERRRVPAVSTVGCGDALVAGFVAGLAETNDPAEALCLAVACGGACARVTRASLEGRAEAEAVLAGVEVEEV